MTAPSFMADLAALVEQHTTEWFAYQAGVPGVEMHQDPDVTWLLHSAGAWGNAATGLRFPAVAAERRLDELVARYRQNGRGVGVWVGPHSSPATLERLLVARGFRCRQRFPAMYLDLSQPFPATRSEIAIDAAENYEEFRYAPYGHPGHGRITTPLRRFALARLNHLRQRRPRRVWEFVARLEGVPVGVCLLFQGQHTAGLHDVAVVPALRRQGIGSALVQHACRFAQAQGAPAMTLIASGNGESVYRRLGFQEVGRLAYWHARWQ